MTCQYERRTHKSCGEGVQDPDKILVSIAYALDLAISLTATEYRISTRYCNVIAGWDGEGVKVILLLPYQDGNCIPLFFSSFFEN
jgi:hypothetical protein